MEINKVYNDDIMNILKALPDNAIDMIYSDPDYNVGMKYNGKSYTKSFAEYIDWYIELAKESLRVLKPDGNMFFINYPKQNIVIMFLITFGFTIPMWGTRRRNSPPPTEAYYTAQNQKKTNGTKHKWRSPIKTLRISV